MMISIELFASSTGGAGERSACSSSEKLGPDPKAGGAHEGRWSSNARLSTGACETEQSRTSDRRARAEVPRPTRAARRPRSGSMRQWELILGYPPNRGLPPAGYPSNQLRPGGLPLQPGYPPVGYPSTRGRRTGYPCTAPTRVTPTDGLPPQGWVTPPIELSVSGAAQRTYFYNPFPGPRAESPPKHRHQSSRIKMLDSKRDDVAPRPVGMGRGAHRRMIPPGPLESGWVGG